MSVGAILKLLHVYLLATVKYFITFPYALVIGLDYTQTIIAVTVGGVSGFFFFYYFSGVIIRYFGQHKEAILQFLREYLMIDLVRFTTRGQKKKISTKSRRTIVKLRRSYGLWGIIIMTPVVLSIPIGAFLLKKYYSTRKNVLAYMLISILGWSLVFTTIVVILPKPL